jgi:diacylglycerol kinase (ATP)
MTKISPLRKRIRAFRFAGRGILAMLASEANAKLHALATGIVVLAGLGFGIERGEWLAVVLSIGAVWTAEGFNTAFEALCDVVSPGPHPKVARAKDVAAGAVLLAALAALAVALIVFGPRVLSIARPLVGLFANA